MRVVLIISDWLIPTINGGEFIEKVHEKYPEIRAIMITGHADGKSIERVSKNESVLAVMGKPWSSIAKDLIQSKRLFCN
ncbi:MAG: hypothetical protein PF637_04070 [Spirochaetes bacterium]|jgi:response regulator RpfG family c-di-GMP phosphodiesterase|nr:hypothetical protein [Spirochaetota bacterium]